MFVQRLRAGVRVDGLAGPDDVLDHNFMPRATEQPSVWRIGAGFLAAPAISAFVFSLASPGYDGLPSFADRVMRTFELVAIVGGYLPTVILGIPAILLLRRWLRPTMLNCALVGASVASLPWLMLVAISRPDEAGRATVIHGVPSLFGYQEDLKFIGMIAALGFLGGVSFWVVAIFNLRPARITA
jgi:hypothetical protein